MKTRTKHFPQLALGMLLVFFVLQSRCIADDSTLTKVGDQTPVASVRTIDGKEIKYDEAEFDKLISSVKGELEKTKDQSGG